LTFKVNNLPRERICDASEFRVVVRK